MKPIEPQEEHHWLKKLIGKWTYESELQCGPDQEPIRTSGTETFRAIGELWVTGDSVGRMPDGSPGMSIITLGYDVNKKAYVGTWIGSMMATMWVYKGERNQAKTELALYSEGPSMSDPSKTGLYRDTIKWINEDERILTGEFQREDGQWAALMKMTYKRA